MKAKQAGAWKDATPFAKAGGIWKPVQEVWVKHAGVWKLEWQNALYSFQVTVGYYAADVYNWYGYTNSGYVDANVNPFGARAATPGGALTPALLDGHGVSAVIAVAGADFIFEIGFTDSGPQNWLAITSMTIAGYTIPGRFVRQNDAKSGGSLNAAAFVPGATANTGFPPTLPWGSEPYKTPMAAIAAAFTYGAVVTVSFN